MPGPYVYTARAAAAATYRMRDIYDDIILCYARRELAYIRPYILYYASTPMSCHHAAACHAENAGILPPHDNAKSLLTAWMGRDNEEILASFSMPPPRVEAHDI